MIDQVLNKAHNHYSPDHILDACLRYSVIWVYRFLSTESEQKISVKVGKIDRCHFMASNSDQS